MAKTRRLGFALIELLVVIAVLALLAAVLVAGVGLARSGAGLGACIGNQRAIAWALAVYEAEWECFPLNYYYYVPAQDQRWALGCLSGYLGGPAGVSDLRGLDIGEFPEVYVCPNADPLVYQHNPMDKYHACYWTNVAIRRNRGWPMLYSHWPPGSGDPVMMDDRDCGGEARFFGAVCPNYVGQWIWHWRSVYHHSVETVANPNGMVFTGDTNNGFFPGYHYTYPGEWHIRPGWGWVHGSLGFDRHRGKMVLSYVDGHARAFPAEELEDYTYWDHIGPPSPEEEATGDFMLNYVGDDGCGGTRIHYLPGPLTP